MGITRKYKLCAMYLKLTVIYIHILDTWAINGYYSTITAGKCVSTQSAPHGGINENQIYVNQNEVELDQCQHDEMVLIQEAVQGIADLNQCYYKRGDCTEAPSMETDTKLTECTGLNACNVPTNVAWMPNCRSYSSYNSIVYSCIPRTDVMDMCESATQTMTRKGYVMSPGYPTMYEENIHCTCNVTVDPGQRLLLTFLDFDVEWSDNCDQDVLEIDDGIDGQMLIPKCGKYPRNHNMTSNYNSISVQFSSNFMMNGKGAWIQFEALGTMEISCGVTPGFETTTTTTTTPAPTTTTIEYIELESDTVYRTADGGYLTQGNGVVHHSSPGKGSTVGIVIGVIIAVLVLVVLALLLIWIKRRRKKKDINKLPHESHLPRLTRRKEKNGTVRGTAQHCDSPQPPTPPTCNNSAQGSPASTKSVESDRSGNSKTELKKSSGSILKKDKKVKF